MGISREQALDCFKSDDLIGIGMEADAVRRQLHPEGVVSYAMSHVVLLGCRGEEEVVAQTRSAEEMGATGVALVGRIVGGLVESTRLIAGLRDQFPDLWLQGFTAKQLTDLATESDQSLQDILATLGDAGLNSIGETAAAIPSETWANVHRAAHTLGMRTSARVVFGAGETFEVRLDQLETIRKLQEETGGFVALAPVSYHAEGGRELDETTAVEYLKTLAVARMYVDNIENVEADWTTQGLKVLQMGLRFGANDVGAVQVERTKGATEEELRRVIRDAGFRPAQREMGYRAMLLNV